ncbi:hypothetical protein L2E82_06730 [Cichorium intybus]|uniref:Uncharacterized protein n=1 Tax=Cichorium intybus TaxID=13427 RepID=A0ACB9HAP0_CICIN|nr:hypothetical protein L2E82_06730 [Cichorium intybus]
MPIISETLLKTNFRVLTIPTNLLLVATFRLPSINTTPQIRKKTQTHMFLTLDTLPHENKTLAVKYKNTNNTCLDDEKS